MPVKELRREILHLKSQPPYQKAIIQLNPKIGTDGQRRLQCSIRLRDVFKHLAPDTDPTAPTHPALWGVEFSGLIPSPPRGRK